MGRLFFSIKNAFTTLELIFVIVVIGILAAVLMPRLKPDRLQDAADVFIETVRFTQHLAMVDDKFTPSAAHSIYTNATQREKDIKQWFKKWWCFYIWDIDGTSSSSYGSGPALVVFSDQPTINSNNKFNSNPSLKEIAIDPLTNKVMSGHEFDSGFEGKIDSRLNLKKTYNVEKIVVDTPCSSKSKIVFDNLGRPHCPQPLDSANLNPYTQLLRRTVKYTLCADDNCDVNISICIFPLTGFINRCS